MSEGERHESRVWVVISPQGRPLWSTCSEAGADAISGQVRAREKLVADTMRAWLTYETRGYKVREITATWGGLTR